METNILIVEDDADIHQLLCTTLKNAGYKVIGAYSGTEAELILRIQGKQIDLVLLDLMLPGISGEEVLQKIRKMGNLPVIVITAKDELDEKISLLTSGADDYITKPFELPEVLARVQIQIRHASAGKEADAKQIVYRDFMLDPATHHVWIGEKRLPNMTKQEFAILELLLRHPNQVFAKEDIFEYAWEEPYMGETKTLDVHISHIRKKIKTVTDDEYIETIWGIGYRIGG